MEQFLKSLLISLNSIEVKGKTNMDYLLGAILAVESVLSTVSLPAEAEEGQEAEGDQENG